MKIKPVTGTVAYAFHCPACDQTHLFFVHYGPQQWQMGTKEKPFNPESPTFTPSLKNTRPPSNYCCHLNLTDGKIIYHPDSSHGMRGQTIDLPEIAE
jgi:hypothetical protein